MYRVRSPAGRMPLPSRRFQKSPPTDCGTSMDAHALHGSAAAEVFDPTVLLRVLSDVKAGDFTARMPGHWIGVEGKIADGLNEIISANQAFATELQRVSRVVGKEGKLSQ